jgi:hypothetical protein
MRNVENQRAYAAQQRANPEYQERQRQWQRDWYAKNRDNPDVRRRKAEQMRSYYSDPEIRQRHLTRRKTRHAVASGKLIGQPCEVCGATIVEAHHDDYSKPFDVRWLCRKHHREHHAKVPS